MRQQHNASNEIAPHVADAGAQPLESQVDPLLVEAVYGGMLIVAHDNWLSAFYADPLVETLPPLPTVDREDAKRALRTISFFQKAIEEDPNNVELRRSLAISLEKINKNEEALLQREQIVTIEPNSVVNLMDLSRLYHKCGRHDEALQTILTAESLDNSNPDVLVMLAGCYNALGNNEMELASIQRAASNSPNSPTAWKCLAQCLVNRGSHKEGVDAWTCYLKIRPEDSLAWRESGNARKLSGDNAGAINDYEEAIRLDPECTISLIALNSVLLHRKAPVLSRFLSFFKFWAD